MEQNTPPKKHIKIACLIVLFFAIFIRFYALNYKDTLENDEIFSIIISNCTEYGWSKNFPINHLYTGKQLKDLFLWNDASLRDAISDIKRLYIYNYDPPHTNLYYSLLRLTFIGVGEFNLTQTILKAGCLNISIFCLGFFLMFKLLQLLFGKKSSLVPFGLFVAFFSTASISNTVYINYKKFHLLSLHITLQNYCYTKRQIYLKLP